MKKINNKSKCNFKSFNLTNILLIILIISVLVLIALTVFKIPVKEKESLQDIIIDGNFTANVETYDVSKINLNEVSLPESELIEQTLISQENISSLESKYNFIFNKELNISLDYLPAEINDVILEYKDYIIIYDFENEIVKSIWLIEYIG